MDKKIYTYGDIKDKISQGLDTITNPVKQTLSPRGGNVLFENQYGDFIMTNDGITIAKEISVKDRLVNSVIEIVKGSALKTNAEAGDGTTTTVILTQVLSKEALKLVEEGISWIDIRDSLNLLSTSLMKRIDSMKIDIKTDAELRNVALIASNNDANIADKVLEVIKTAGEDGMVFIEPNNKKETELTKDLGFMLKTGILYQELLLESRPVIKVKDINVLLTDKRLYYSEEAEAILRIAIKMGWNNVAIIARDFIGEAVPTFIANHKKNINILLIKDEKCTENDNTSMEDLALYLGGKIVTDKTGNLVNNITAKDFVLVNSIYQDPTKTLITPKVSSNKSLKERIKYLKEELDKNKEDKTLKERLSSLTNGVVTIRVGGSTGIEVRERLFRYEDAVNATRIAKKFGYLVGGGVSLLNAYNENDYTVMIRPIAKKFTEAIIRQIATNCGKHDDTVVENIRKVKSKSFGYNALTDKYEDLLKAGVVDAYMSVKMAVENSVSATNTIVSIKYYLINDVKDKDNENKTSNEKSKTKGN